jgi:aspartate/methionine/tyrosine aminotransferase
MGLPVAKRADIAPFYVMEVMKAAGERAAAGAEVLHLEVGQPSTPAPRVVRARATELLAADPLHYTDAVGWAPLRERIAAWYAESHGVAVDPGRVVVTAGASGACVLAFLACFDVGARVAVARPGYPCYRQMLTALGVQPVEVPVGPANRFQPDVAALDAVVAGGGPLDGLVVASPSNPTGTVLDGPAMARLAGWCGDHGVRLVSDEIYHGITYGPPAATAVGTADAVVVNSFSKYFSMTGWRLGWLVLPGDLVVPVERLAQNLTVAPPTLPQLAGIAAFDATDELDAHVARYAANRDVLLGALVGMGLDRVAPADGAFYLWVDVSDRTDDSAELCRRWLDELEVAVTPGIDFDPVDGHRFVRLSYSRSREEVAEAAGRLAHWRP